jgi:hypothetical protein
MKENVRKPGTPLRGWERLDTEVTKVRARAFREEDGRRITARGE